ncbi:MAG: hypothetical protein U0793_03720 [Gemmataceae bacterium]
MTQAYPQGEATIPPRKLPYFAIGSAADLREFLPPADRATGIAREVTGPTGELSGYEFRLGSAHFPHLKLRVQWVDNQNGSGWIFMVDTHDHFPRLDAGADEAAWRQVQQINRQLKEAIEKAFEEAGITTLNKLLRDGL